jgi:GNAT superfamily N-acetyltransferase
MLEVVVARADLASDVALRLITALNADLSARYPEEGANHFRLDLDEVAPGRGLFVIARDGERAVACGALRRLVDEGFTDAGEIKRMYTLPEVRGQGIAGRVLGRLEVEARALGLTRLLLETGERQPEALALYRRCGFAVIEPFGEYVGSPLSVCMEKHLAPITTRRVAVDAPEAIALQCAMEVEVNARYDDISPPWAVLDPAEVAPGRGTFLLAEEGGRVLGCGALRRLSEPGLEGAAEVKRMYVVPEGRGHGVARVVLDALEAEARALGVAQMVLETGDRQPEAIALYARAGFEMIPRFGEAWTHPLSVFMGKRLD